MKKTVKNKLINKKIFVLIYSDENEADVCMAFTKKEDAIKAVKNLKYDSGEVEFVVCDLFDSFLEARRIHKCDCGDEECFTYSHLK